MALQNTYGLVYVWYDRKHKMFYIGSHWGTEDDGYVCSSKRMLRAYRKRPTTFAPRRVLTLVYTNRQDLREAEQRWLDMIKPEELGARYYNLKQWAMGGMSPEGIEKMRQSKIGKTTWMKGRSHKPESREKMSRARIGVSMPQEIRNKISATSRGRQFTPGWKISAGKKGKPSALRGRSRPRDVVEKIARANRGKRPTKIVCHCGVAAVPGMYARWHGEKCKR